jgi:hypothetical protein
MQDLGVVEIETAGHKSLPALIAAKPLKNFSGLREDLSKSVAAFYAAELMLKMTPDEEPNAEAYGFLLDYLQFLNETDIASLPVFSIVDSFSLRLLRSLGFSIEHAQETFNMPPSLRDSITLLVECRFPELPQLGLDERNAKKSHEVVKNFIEFILERNIKSDQFLMSV